MDKIAAVIVTYNNAAMLRLLLGDITKQTRIVDMVIIIDNASPDNTQKMVASEFPQFKYVKLEENQGSAGGYHEGMKMAMDDHDFIWTLDDDVHLPNDSLEELYKGLENLQNSHSNSKAAVVRAVGKGSRLTGVIEMDIYTWRGCLFDVEALKKVGLPKKEYFLYGEDLEHSYRLLEAGYKFYYIPSSKCLELRWEKIQDTFWGRRFSVYPDAFRLYYGFRNECHILLKYQRIKEFFNLIGYALKVTCYFLISKKMNSFKVRAILMGLVDGLFGKLGRNETFLPNNFSEQ